jgi:hypothetical protein
MIEWQDKNAKGTVTEEKQSVPILVLKNQARFRTSN